MESDLRGAQAEHKKEILENHNVKNMNELEKSLESIVGKFDENMFKITNDAKKALESLQKNEDSKIKKIGILEMAVTLYNEECEKLKENFKEHEKYIKIDYQKLVTMSLLVNNLAKSIGSKKACVMPNTDQLLSKFWTPDEKEINEIKEDISQLSKMEI